MDNQSTRPFLKSYLKEVMLLIAASPAAIGLISKFDDQFNFLDLFENIIIKYQQVSRAFWGAILYFIPDNVYYDHMFLTFLLLSLIPAITSIALYRENPYRDEGSYWFFTNIFCFFIICMIFISNYISYIVLSIVLTSYVVIPITMFIMLFAFLFRLSYDIDRLMMYFFFTGFLLSLMISPLLVVFYDQFSEHSEKVMSGNIYYNILIQYVYLLLLILTLPISAIALLIGSKSYSYILLLAVGIFLSNWISIDVVPPINSWVEGL